MSTTSDGGLFQTSIYVAVLLQQVLFGVELVLYCQTMYRLLSHPGKRKKSDVFYAIFSTVMLMMATVWVSTQALFCGTLWLGDEPFPSTADEYWAMTSGVWYMNLATTALVVLQLMTDALMIYRCWAVWGSYYVIILPLMLWTTSLVTIICWPLLAQKEESDFHAIAVQFGLPYYCVSIFLTAMLTGMICYRLLWHGKTVKEHLTQEYASPYFAVAVVMVESMLPHTISGIAFLVSFGLTSQMMSIFGYVYALIMCVSPQMLILRVAMGTAWKTRTDRTTRPHSTIRFSPQEHTSVSTCLEASHTQVIGSEKGSINIV